VNYPAGWEEMPMEEGFPAYLPSRLAAFYERAGHVKKLWPATKDPSVSSPRSHLRAEDFSEPVTAHTRRFPRFLGADRDWPISVTIRRSAGWTAIQVPDRH